MCKTLRTCEWFEFLIIFLCSSYRYIIYMHSHSNLCHNTKDYLIFDWEKSIRYSRPRISNVWEKSTFQIRQNYPALVGFLLEPDFCRIWNRAGRSRSRNPVQPYSFVLRGSTPQPRHCSSCIPPVQWLPVCKRVIIKTVVRVLRCL